MIDATDLAALITACGTDLGCPELWFTPDGYPDSLALCIIDSIYSTGARYSSVVKIIGRYGEYRKQCGGDADTDGTDELAVTIAELGGPDLWATRIGNRRPISTRAGAPLKGHDDRYPGHGSSQARCPHYRRLEGRSHHPGCSYGRGAGLASHARPAVRDHVGLRADARPDSGGEGRPHGDPLSGPGHRNAARKAVA